MGKIPTTIVGVGQTRTLSVGARKALGNFIDEYGRKEGERIYLAKAEERGQGNTLRQKVNSVYKTGAKLK